MPKALNSSPLGIIPWNLQGMNLFFSISLFFREERKTIDPIRFEKVPYFGLWHVDVRIINNKSNRNTCLRLLDKCQRKEWPWSWITSPIWGNNSSVNFKSLFTYHNLCELSIEFAFFRHRLWKLLKRLHSLWMVDAIANFGVVWARSETAHTTLSRHFTNRLLSFHMNHEYTLPHKPSRIEKVKRRRTMSGRNHQPLRWPTITLASASTKREAARDFKLHLSRGGVVNKSVRVVTSN